MYIVIQKEPLALASGDVIEIPLSHPQTSRTAALQWLVARGMGSVGKVVSLGWFIASGGLEPGRN